MFAIFASLLLDKFCGISHSEHKKAMETAVRPTMKVVSMLNEETAFVASHLESDHVYHDIEYITRVWSATGLPESELADELEKVAAMMLNGSAVDIDLDLVDWDFLARRYAEMFTD